jgi:hypothetical protein
MMHVRFGGVLISSQHGCSGRSGKFLPLSPSLHRWNWEHQEDLTGTITIEMSRTTLLFPLDNRLNIGPTFTP